MSTSNIQDIINRFPHETTRAAVKYLLTGDPDALDHLIAICWRALGKTRLLNDDLRYTRGKNSSVEETRGFVINFLLNGIDRPKGFKGLNAYKSLPADELAKVATREFEYLGRLCRLALIDENRKRKRTPEHSGKMKHDEPIGSGTISVLDGLYVDAIDLADRAPTAEEVLALISPELDKQRGEALEAMLLTHPDRRSKGEITEAIAAHRNVSLEQARADKRKLQKDMNKLLREGHSGAVWVHKSLATTVERSIKHVTNRERGRRIRAKTLKYPGMSNAEVGKRMPSITKALLDKPE